MKNNYANTLNFEHTYFITEEVATYLFNSLGYKVEDIEHFQGHSIFFSLTKERTENNISYPKGLYTRIQGDVPKNAYIL